MIVLDEIVRYVLQILNDFKWIFIVSGAFTVGTYVMRFVGSTEDRKYKPCETTETLTSAPVQRTRKPLSRRQRTLLQQRGATRGYTNGGKR